MSEQLTDQVLVERVQKGDQKAFNLLVVRYQHKVASLVSRYVPPGDIADVVQESFVKAWRALDSFRGIALLHLVISHRRQHGEKLSGCSGTPSAVQRC